jgi:outer membrane receptor protein involved in Fe transport
MNRIKMLGIATSLLIFHLSINAQTIKGSLSDENARAVSYATIGLLQLPDSTMIKEQVTDSAGRFSIGAVPQGKYILQISATGFVPLSREINLTAAVPDQDLGKLIMQSDPAMLNAVIVNGTRPAFQRQGDRLVVSVAGSPFFRTATNGFDVLNKIPGLEVSYDGTLLLSGRTSPAVFIDGKPVPMSAEELQQYLQTLTPEMIASVDVITNPSGKYDGEFKGIIDIKLKKDQALGWKGFLTSNLQVNNYALSENSLLLTYKTPSTAFMARGGYTGGSRIYRYEAWQHLANTNFMNTKNGVSTRFNTFNVQLGAEHNFSKDHKVELLLRTTQNKRDLNASGTLHTTNTSHQLVSLVGTDNESSPIQQNYAINLNYSGKLGKSQLQWLNTFLSIRTRQQENIQSSDLVDPKQLLWWKTDLKNDIDIVSTQADLSSEWGNGKISTGIKFAHSITYNDSRYDTLDQQKQFVPDHSRTNLFRYREYIGAGYLGWESQIGKFSYNVSVRAENTSTIADAISAKLITRRSYWHLLPSAGISYAMDEENQFQLSLSRKLTRPVFSQLNPFRIYNSPLNYFIGNPYLSPAVTTALNLSYSRRGLNISFNIGRDSEPLGRYPKYDPVTNVLEYLGKNFDHRSFANLEISMPIELTKWWRMSNTVGGYYEKETVPYFEYTFSKPFSYFTVNGTQLFSLPEGITLDLHYFYKSSAGNSLYTGKSLSNIDFGIQRSWFKGKLSSKLNVYDIFNKYRVMLTFREKQIIDNTLSHWPGMRKLGITLSYSFGRSTYKAKQQSRNEEESRTL